MIKSKGIYLVYVNNNIYCINITGKSPVLNIVGGFNFKEFLKIS